MPTYGYTCTSCEESHEAIQNITADPLTKCPHCKKETLVRGPGGGIGLSFKTSGFYITDYARKKEKKKEETKKEEPAATN